DDGLCPGRRPYHPGPAGGGRRGGGEHLRLPAVRLRGGHRQHSGDGGAEAGWPGTEDPGHRLHDPAVQAGRSERAAGGGRHSGHRQLRRYLRRHRRGDGGLWPEALPPGQHPHRPPGRGTHPVHAPLVCLPPHRRGVRQPLRLLCDPLPAGQIPQPPHGGPSGRGQGAGGRRREGAAGHRPGYHPVWNGPERRAPAGVSPAGA
ncbi:Conserved hypothetical integral membrane protein, partial [Dysosmobacter welbionis]